MKVCWISGRTFQDEETNQDDSIQDPRRMRHDSLTSFFIYFFFINFCFLKVKIVNFLLTDIFFSFISFFSFIFLPLLLLSPNTLNKVYLNVRRDVIDNNNGSQWFNCNSSDSKREKASRQSDAKLTFATGNARARSAFYVFSFFCLSGARERAVLLWVSMFG